MDNNKPLLSICIPTYNRCVILKDVLEQYVNNPEFDNSVELVISDNASTDDTERICREYCEKYNNIKYNRNKENIRDANFPKVLCLGSGEYLKLFNDCVYCSAESLRYIKDKIRENLISKTPVFFTSNYVFTKYKAEVMNGAGLDDYVKFVSTFVTYNNIFGVWNEHWKDIKDKSFYSALQLQQVDWTYQIVSSCQRFVIYDVPVFYGSKVPLGVRGGYNWFQIHLDNYYKIMRPYIESGLISYDTFKQDKHNLLEHFKPEFCYSFFYNFNSKWRFDTKDTMKLLLKYYGRDPYLVFYLLKLPFYYLYLASGALGNRTLKLIKNQVKRYL